MKFGHQENSTMSEAVIVSAVRTPVGRAYKGTLRATRPDDLAALVIKEAIGAGARSRRCGN
jgi:acetyl-CoA acetyltransferase